VVVEEDRTPEELVAGGNQFLESGKSPGVR